MAIPLPTTTIAIWGNRPVPQVDPDAEGYDPAPTPPVQLASGLNACISGPSVSVEGGSQVERWMLRVDPCDLHKSDRVLDEDTGVWYEVISATASRPTLFGLNHVRAELEIREGLPDDRR